MAVHATLVSFQDAEEAVEQLINQAINNGGPDNITCVVADVVDTVAGPVAPSRGHQVVGAAANPDARSLLKGHGAAAAAAMNPETESPASANGYLRQRAGMPRMTTTTSTSSMPCPGAAGRS